MKNYITNFKNYTSKFKKTVLARTALLMGLTVSLTGCGQDVKQQPDEPTPGAQIVMETETKENKTPIETTVEEMIETETKAQTKENKTTKEPTTEYKAKEEKEEKEEKETETKAQTTEEKKETTTKEHQEETTQSHKETTQAHRETISNSSSPLTPSLKRSSRPTTEEKEETTHKTTAKVTTTKKPTTTTTTKRTTTTTKKTTTTTTTTHAPITEAPTEPATEAPTEPITEAPTEYYEVDYSFENIAHDSAVFRYHASDLKYELFHGISIDTIYGTTSCGTECELLLAILNYGQIDDNVLQSVFQYYSESDIKNCQNFLYDYLGYAKKELGSNVDFTKYTLDKTVGEYLNSLEQAADNGTIVDMIRNEWEGENIPEYPAIFLALESYDERYNGNQIIYPGTANGYIVDRTVDDIINKALGRSYTR